MKFSKCWHPAPKSKEWEFSGIKSPEPCMCWLWYRLVYYFSNVKMPLSPLSSFAPIYFSYQIYTPKIFLCIDCMCEVNDPLYGQRRRVHILITFQVQFYWSVKRLCVHAFSCCWLTIQWLNLWPVEGHTGIETSLNHLDDLGDWVLGKAFFAVAFWHICIYMYMLLHINIKICTKQIPESLIKLVHSHVTGKKIVFPWGWSVGIG